MKKKKNILILILIIIVSLIIIFLVHKILNSNKIKKENINEITNIYDNLTKDINDYNDIRTRYNKKISSFVLATYDEEHEDYIDLLTEYNETIKKIDNETSKLKNKCSVLYNDININKICRNYKTMYEKLINIYVTDLNIYNDNIKKYNEYQEENFELFEMIHEEYIDYNNDKIYEGRATDETTKEEKQS